MHLIYMDEMEEIFFHVPPYKEIDLLYSLIKQEPDFLHKMESKQFVETPLHFAAGVGRTELALEIQRLMPSLGMKLNAEGFSPLHVALRGGHYDTVRAMVRLNPELVGVQGREGMTPLHCAAEIGAVDLVAELLTWWPESIEKLTVREETAVHVAVKSREVAALKVLVGWVRRKGKWRVLEWKDLEGNTALHLAASTNQPQILKLLYAGVNEKNCKGLTALDIAMKLPRHQDNSRAVSILRRHGGKEGSSITQPQSLSDYLSSHIYFSGLIGVLGQYIDKGIPKEMRSAALVVAGLIVTSTYEGVLRPSGIVAMTQTPIMLNITRFDNSSVTTNSTGFAMAGQALNLSRAELRERDVVFGLEFMLPNCSALAASLGMILLLLPCCAYNLLLHFSLVSLVFSTYMTLASTEWWQPEMKVGTVIGTLSFFFVIMGLLWMKITSVGEGMLMKQRLTVRDHRIMT